MERKKRMTSMEGKKEEKKKSYERGADTYRVMFVLCLLAKGKTENMKMAVKQ